MLHTLAGRRDRLRILGSDIDPGVPELRQCDEFVKLPPVDDPAFVHEVEAACGEVDLLIPGTDTDVAALAASANDPDSPIRMACAPAELVRMSRDKATSARWCESHGIPFAATVSTDDPDAAALVDRLLADHGFPLIAKPRAGSASIGVVALLDRGQLQQVLAQPGMIVQPFYEPPPVALAPDLASGVPLFWEIPCPDEPAVMGLIGPNGEIGPDLCFTSTHRLGRNEDMGTLVDATLADFSHDVVRRFADLGWRGPLNLQVRRAADGWRIIEINPRFTGGTAGRMLLGLDEVAWVLNRWLGFEAVPPREDPPVSRVVMRMTEFPVS